MADNEQVFSSQSSDIQFFLNSQLAQKLLQSVEFPLEMHFLEHDEAATADPSGTGEGVAEDDANVTPPEPDVEEKVATWGDFSVTFPKDFPSDEKNLSVDDVEERMGAADLEDTIAGISEDRNDLEVAESVPDDALAADGPGKADSSQSLPDKKRSRVEIMGLSLTVVSAPDVQIGNPVVLSNLTIKVRAKLRVFVQLFGRWHSFPIKIPQVTLQGQSATLTLTARGATIVATPELQDLDITTAVKVFKKTIPLKFSVSRFVNKHLGRREPLSVIDLGTMSRSMIFGAGHPDVQVAALANRPEGLLVKLNFIWHNTIEAEVG